MRVLAIRSAAQEEGVELFCLTAAQAAMDPDLRGRLAETDEQLKKWNR